MLTRVSIISNPAMDLNMHGWFRWQEQFTAKLTERKPLFCVEIGVWTGCSALFTAQIIKEWGGCLLAIDPFDGTLPIDDEPCRSIALTCYEQFLSNVYHHRLEKDVFVIKGTVKDVPTIVRPDWIYIDSSHTFEGTTRDLEWAWGALKPGGIILGDDFGMPEVQRAWTTFFHRPIEWDDQLVWVTKSEM